MKLDRSGIGDLLWRRLDLAGLYLCGPFDSAGGPASPDIHVLALSLGDDVRDLHLMPAVAATHRRIEVSVVPWRDLKEALEAGIATWSMFYTVDKLRRAVPIMETRQIADVRQAAAKGVRLKPSFYSAVLRSLASLGRALATETAAGPAALMQANALVLLSLALRQIVLAKHTFSRYSQLLEEAAQAPEGALAAGSSEHEQATAGGMLASSEHMIGAVFKTYGIELSRLRTIPGLGAPSGEPR